MDWIKENKFLSALIGCTLLFGGGIFYFGYAEGSVFDEKMGEHGTLKTTYTKLVSAKPYPDSQNLQARKDNVKEYEEVIAGLRQALDAYRPGKPSQLTPGEFSDIQLEMKGKLRQAFEKAGTSLPDNCGFGFEKYATIQAKPNAVADLNYQLGAIEWLLGKLAETRPHALINIRRVQLAVEKGVVAPPPPPSNKRGSRNQPKQGEGQVEKLFEAMPMELAFTARESSVRDFLKEMANSQQYFYAIRTIRIRNEKQTAPTVKDANFQTGRDADLNENFAPADEGNPFPGFALPGDDGEALGEAADIAAPAPEPVTSGDHILKQVLGNEKLNIHICFDILFIKGDAKAESENSASSPGGA